jgi:hypothetical protein
VDAGQRVVAGGVGGRGERRRAEQARGNSGGLDFFLNEYFMCFPV